VALGGAVQRPPPRRRVGRAAGLRPPGRGRRRDYGSAAHQREQRLRGLADPRLARGRLRRAPRARDRRAAGRLGRAGLGARIRPPLPEEHAMALSLRHWTTGGALVCAAIAVANLPPPADRTLPPGAPRRDAFDVPVDRVQLLRLALRRNRGALDRTEQVVHLIALARATA